jgi:membrane-bound serine protease (ClpP class)
MITWVLILFAGGMVLILAEFIVPGMICGILGGLLVISSAGLGCYTYPDYTWTIIVGELAGVFASIILGMFLLSRTRAGKNLILSSSQQADAGWVAAASDAALTDAEGEVFTALRPAGTILVHGKRIDAVSDGTFIDKGAKVRVIAVHGSRVVVEQVSNK